MASASLFYLIALGLTLSVFAISEEDLNRQIRDEIVKCGIRSGIVVAAVSLNHSFAYANGFGMRDIEKNIPADNKTFLCIGSVSKHFAATLLVHLLDRMQTAGYGNFTLQTLITELDPTLALEGSQLINVTLEDILSHRTGLTNYFGPLMMGYPSNYTSKDLAHVSTKLPRLAPPREKFIYNNHIYALAGYASEILGSTLHNQRYTWAQLLKLELLDKLGISDDVNFAIPESGYLDRAALGYGIVNGTYKVVPSIVAETVKPAASAGAICMSPKAMNVWMTFLLNRGMHNGQRIVRADSIEETWKPRIAYSDPLENGSYGLGWDIGSRTDVRQMLHLGGISTYTSHLEIYPDQKVGLFFSASVGTQQTAELLMSKVVTILRQATGIPTFANSTTNKTCSDIPLPPYQPPFGTPTIIDKKLYTGTFNHPVYGNLRMVDREDSLVLEIGAIGVAAVHCQKYSSEYCVLAFEGPLNYITVTDGSPMANYTVVFGKSCTGYVVNVSMPIYSPDPVIAFSRLGPVDEKCPSSRAPTLLYGLPVAVLFLLSFFIAFQ